MKVIDYGLGGYEILQLPNSTDVQMMGYLIKTPEGLVAIDGGNPGDTPLLRDLIRENGGHVILWLLTHCHDDHYSAPAEIFADPDGITVDRVCYHFPPYEWLHATEPAEPLDLIFDRIREKPELFCVVEAGEVLHAGGLEIKVLNDPMRFEEYSAPSPNKGSSINDTSLVFRILFPNGKIALFLGDLGLRAGNILAEDFGPYLKSDIVQMAHHGQNGADENVYRLIRPDVCLWTAPTWLYNNDRGDGFNTAIYKTVTVRGWMEKLGVTLHAVEGEGLTVIR